MNVTLDRIIRYVRDVARLTTRTSRTETQAPPSGIAIYS